MTQCGSGVPGGPCGSITIAGRGGASDPQLRVDHNRRRSAGARSEQDVTDLLALIADIASVAVVCYCVTTTQASRRIDDANDHPSASRQRGPGRSEHTSELQSLRHLV